MKKKLLTPKIKNNINPIYSQIEDFSYFKQNLNRVKITK